METNEIMRKGFKDSNAFPVASNMPAGLKHWPDAPDLYDPAKSEVIKWLIGQPEVLQYLFFKCTTAKAIVFDPETKTWRGKDSQ